MAFELDCKTKRAIAAAFKKYDADGDGHVCPGELVSAMKAMGVEVKLDTAKEMIKAYDGDNSGTLELEEFEAMLTMRAKICYETQIRDAFNKLDKDRCGTITTRQLEEVISREESFTPEQVKALVKEADTNNDGLINYSEFLNMMEPQTDDQTLMH